MKPRAIRVEGDLAFVPLTQGKEAIIDVADIGLVEGRNWYANRQRYTFYAVGWRRSEDGRKRLDLMHRLIAGGAEVIDHIDQNGLNNRRANLRKATVTENNRNRRIQKNNTSGFKGVSWDKRRGVWNAQIKNQGRRLNLGSFETAALAGAAYLEASKRLHGEFARER